MTQRILVVDDDKNIRYSLRRLLEDGEHQIEEAASGEEVLNLLEDGEISLILMDIQMRGMNGLEALQEIKKRRPHVPVIILTAFGTTANAIEAIKRGAYEYVLKPFNPEQLRELVGKALELHRLMHQEVKLVGIYEAKQKEEADALIGGSPKMQEVYKLIGKIAASDVTVLLRGESGTGKELVARAIYQHSKRADQLFLPVNCAAIPENLLESELFGHEKGAFTGASQLRIGKFEQCHGGTLFLDEIGDLHLTTQAKILRVLQEKEFQRIGGNALIKTNVRLLAATNRNLEKMIQEKLFREDLYYRLNVVSIYLPPLRERNDDILELALYFARKYGKEIGREKVQTSKEARTKLKSYHWPGNVRELENCVQRALVLSRGKTLQADDFVFTPLEGGLAAAVGAGPSVGLSLEEVAHHFFALLKDAEKKHQCNAVLEELEKKLIRAALLHTRGNQLRAARLVGMNRNTLHKKMAEYGIQIEAKVS